MNAPAPTALAGAAKQLAAEFDQLPIANITPSETHIQALRRKRYSKEALGELAESIARVGVAQPILVRPLAALRGLAKYEIVAGERRWLAAERAGLGHIPVTIRQLTEEEVLEIQLIENLQREGLHELEEAEGYDELRKLKKVGAEEIARMIGKSRSYVFNRLKLLDLCPEGRSACYEGKLPASTAMLVARIGHHDTQRAALKAILTGNYRSDEPLSYREARELIERSYMLQLKGAPFALDDATLAPKAGACTGCPKRTGNQRELFADVKSPDVCTDPKCYGAKRAVFFERKRAELAKAGKKVITGADAKRIFPYGDHSAAHNSGYLKLEERVYDDPRQRTAAEILGKDKSAVEYVELADAGKLLEVVPQKAITAALNAKGIKTHRQKVAAQRMKGGGDDAHFEQDVCDAVFARTLKLAHERFSGTLGVPELRMVAEELWNAAIGLTTDDETQALAGLWDWKVRGYTPELPKEAQKLNTNGLARLIVDCLVVIANERDGADTSKKLFEALKIDRKAIEKEVRAELKAKAEAGAAPKDAPAPGKKATKAPAPAKAGKAKKKKAAKS